MRTLPRQHVTVMALFALLLMLGACTGSVPVDLSKVDPFELFLTKDDLGFGKTLPTDSWKACPAPEVQPLLLQDSGSESKNVKTWSIGDCGNTAKARVVQVIWIMPTNRESQRLEENVRFTATDMISSLTGMESQEVVSIQNYEVWIARNDKKGGAYEFSSIVVRIDDAVVQVMVVSEALVARIDLVELAEKTIARVEAARER